MNQTKPKTDKERLSEARAVYEELQDWQAVNELVQAGATAMLRDNFASDQVIRTIDNALWSVGTQGAELIRRLEKALFRTPEEREKEKEAS